MTKREIVKEEICGPIRVVLLKLKAAYCVLWFNKYNQDWERSLPGRSDLLAPKEIRERISAGKGFPGSYHRTLSFNQASKQYDEMKELSAKLEFKTTYEMKENYKILYDLIINSNHEKKVLRGILFYGTTALASDNYVLVALQSAFPEHYKGQIVDTDENFIYEGGYPDAQKELNKLMYATSVDSKGVKEACEILPKSSEDDMIVLEIGELCVYPPRLLKVIPVFEALQEKPEVLTYISLADNKENRLILKSKNCTAVMAPVFAPDGPDVNKFTIEEALTVGDLL
jgi:hypothetical protein